MYILKSAKYGIRNIRSNVKTILFPITYLVALLGIWIIVRNNVPIFELLPLPQLYVWLFNIALVGLAIIGTIGILAVLGKHLLRDEERLADIYYGKNMDSPKILSIRRKGDLITYILFSEQIPLSVYRDKQEQIETALNMYVQIKAGKDKQHTIVTGTSAFKALPNLIEWNNSYTSQDDFVLTLGINTADKNREVIDISSTPHILLGGGTGSGKSQLLRLLAFQCFKKGAEVKICDFKGGVDFNRKWHEKCEFVTSEEEMKKLLEKAVNILKERQNVLENRDDCTNIQEYNKSAKIKWKRIIIVCDEIAEILDSTGKSREEKALTSQIERNLRTLARMGRFAGIHLIFSTQRPSAEVIDGDIKNNFGYRICGRCDSVLSKIILDNTEGAAKVPQDGQGLFLTNTGAIFKAYYLRENCFDME